MGWFTSRLLNGSFGDAALLLESARTGTGLLFDLGDLHVLSAKELLKISHVFVSHTHLDHFAGFEQLLRQNLSRPAPLHLYGPRDFIRQVQAKLQGFTWNLINDPCYTLEIIVTEVRPRGLLRQRFLSRDAFTPQAPPAKLANNQGLLLDNDDFSVHCAILDHGTPSLAFCLTEKARRHIETRALEVLGLKDGPWLKDFLAALAQGRDDKCPVTVPDVNGLENTYDLGYLRRNIVAVTPPRKLAYVTDLVYSPGNIRKVRRLAYKADMLYIEAAFMAADAGHAPLKKHLTTGQCAAIIKMCRPKQWTIFHFSHKYQKREDLVWAEVRETLKALNQKAPGKPDTDASLP